MENCKIKGVFERILHVRIIESYSHIPFIKTVQTFKPQELFPPPSNSSTRCLSVHTPHSVHMFSFIPLGSPRGREESARGFLEGGGEGVIRSSVPLFSYDNMSYKLVASNLLIFPLFGRCEGQRIWLKQGREKKTCRHDGIEKMRGGKGEGKG